MSSQLNRRSFLLAIALAPLTALAFQGTASADDRRDHREPAIKKGVFEGIYHTDRVTFIVEKVGRDGCFTGEIHFDPRGRWGDVRAPFHGKTERDGSLTLTRDDCDGQQVARTGRPEYRGRALVWKGDVCGPDFKLPFELRIPEGR